MSISRSSLTPTGVFITAVVLLAMALLWRFGNGHAPIEAPASGDGLAQAAAVNPLLAEFSAPRPARELPVHHEPVSPQLAALADRSSGSRPRTHLLAGGSIPFVEAPQDVLLVRRIVLDPTESDTLRNEALNLLNRSQVVERHDDLRLIAEHPLEDYRFRSFAVQHLGADFVDGVAMAWSGETPLRVWMNRLAADTAEHPAVRREALWPLARQGDAQALALAETLIQDAAATWAHDLCSRIAELHQLSDWCDAIHAIAVRPRDEREAPAESNCCGGSKEPGKNPAAIVEPNRLAALRALVALGDERAAPLLEVAASDGGPHVRAFARRALGELAVVPAVGHVGADEGGR